MNEYCKVCKYLSNPGRCLKGWNKFCHKTDFEPSQTWTIFRFLCEMEEQGIKTLEELQKINNKQIEKEVNDDLCRH